MDVAICGIGETKYSRSSGKTAAELALEAVRAAVDDAGISLDQIDGVIPCHRNLPAETVIANFGLPEVTFTAAMQIGGASSVASLGLASLALAAGRATYVVQFIGRTNSSGVRIAGRVQGGFPNQTLKEQLEYPFGWTTPAQMYSMICRRHMHEYGTTKQQLGTVAVTLREHAQLNENAMMYGRPITLDDYMNSDIIADPYAKLDCCLESDGGTAIVLTTLDRARDARAAPAVVAAVAEGHPRSPDDLTNRDDWFTIGLSFAAPRAFARAGVRPADMDGALIYDCFTFETLHQLEEAGFCARGESGAFVEAGNIALGGSLPVNPHGGLMSAAHIGSLNNIAEAVRQLRGEAGRRQIPDASWLAVTGWGDLGDGSIALLRCDRR